MSVLEVYRPVIACISQVISPGDVPSYIRELHMPCISPISSTYVRVKGSQPPFHVGVICFCLNVSEITLNRS